MDFLQTAWQRRPVFVIAVVFTVIFAAGFFAGSQTSALVRGADGALVVNGASFEVNGQLTQTSPPDGVNEDFAPFWEVYNLIQDNYIDDIPTETLVNGAIGGLVDSLGDQYSAYIEPEFFEFIDTNLSGSIEGIGVVIREIEETGEIEVVNVLEGTPADRAGLREGDIFLQVEGEDVIGVTYLELAARVRGPSGTIVNITMRRGDNELDFAVERARIEIPNIETEVYDNGIGYISMASFSRNARQQLDEGLESINYRELNGLIIDLRGNPGGLLSTAIDIGSLLIDDGPVLYEQFGDGSEQVFNADGTALDFGGIPIVLLVDERSASASELVAGAWQDLDLVTVIGTTTLGKGTVQNQSALVNGGGVRLTIARWLTPNRNWIHEVGVVPDIEVEWSVEDREENPDDDPQLQAALDFLDDRIADSSE